MLQTSHKTQLYYLWPNDSFNQIKRPFDKHAFLQFVVVPYTNNSVAVGHGVRPVTVASVVDPVALVDAAISLLALALTVAIVGDPVALVDVAVGVRYLALAVSIVVHPAAVNIRAPVLVIGNNATVGGCAGRVDNNILFAAHAGQVDKSILFAVYVGA